jgi:hypothetical protein
LYFDDEKSCRNFVSRDAHWSKPLVLNNASIKSVAIGRFSEENAETGIYTIERSFKTFSGWNSTGKASAAEHLSRLTGLEELILLLDGDSVCINPGKTVKSVNKKIISAFKSIFELSLFQMSDPAVKRINTEGKRGWYGLTLPVSASTWWKNPTITITSKDEYLENIISTAIYWPKLKMMFLRDIQYLSKMVSRLRRNGDTQAAEDMDKQLARCESEYCDAKVYYLK